MSIRLNELAEEVRTKQPLSARKLAMLKAALAIITRGGFESLSLRGVAERVGVKLPSVQYHFGNKSRLVSALFDWSLEWYSGELLRIIAKNNATPEKAFRAVIDFLISDLNDRTGIEPHLWAYAMHNEEAATLRNRYLYIYREFLYDLLSQMGTIKSDRRRWYRAASITALIEGTFQITSKAVPKDLAKFERETKLVIWHLADL